VAIIFCSGALGPAACARLDVAHISTAQAAAANLVRAIMAPCTIVVSPDVGVRLRAGQAPLRNFLAFARNRI
jgi:hypothetical protein